MKKMKYKSLVFLLLLVGSLCVIGATIAYYTSSDTFNNEFNTGTYVIQTQENFVSPDDWIPGTTTDKTVIATNKGTTPVAVRVKLTPNWIGSDGVTTLPPTDGTNEAAIINYAFDKDYKWEKVGDWYYYIRPLDTNESTSSLLESVTFNPNVDVSASHECVENETTHETICTTETTGYSDATYKLQVDIETCQFDKYKEIWNTNVDISKPETIVDGTLKTTDSPSYDVYGKNVGRSGFEKVIVLDVISIPSNAIDSWDASVEGNGSIMAWYTDENNNGNYELYIGQEGGVKANPNSNYSFAMYMNATYLNLKYLDVSNVESMSDMFYYTGYNGNSLPSFRISGMENWNTSNVETMYDMFQYTGRSTTDWSIGDISNWDTSHVKDMSFMFHYTAYKAKEFNIGEIGKWDLSSATNTSHMFVYCASNAKWGDFGTIDLYSDNIESMFVYASDLKAIVNIHNNPTNYNGAFNVTATTATSSVVVNYSSSTPIDAILSTVHPNSNITKGVQLD